MTAIEQAKDAALDKTGLDWSRRDSWSDSQRTAYLAANAEFRRENQLLFTPAELASGVNFASAAAAPKPKADYVGAVTGSVFGELTRLNPFSEGNLTKIMANLSKIAALAAVVATLYLVIKYTPEKSK